MTKLINILVLLLFTVTAHAYAQQRGTGFFSSSGGSVAATDPDDVANLEQWLDANQLTGLIDGDPVATFTDQSGNGYSGTQATGSLRALYKTNILNGKPVVRFDNSNDYYVFTRGSGGAAATLFVVFKNTGTSTPRSPIYTDCDGSGNHDFKLQISSDGTMRGYLYSDAYRFDFASIAVGTTWHYVCLAYAVNDAAIRLDGSTVSTDTSVDVSTWTTDGANRQLGQDAFGSFTFGGDVAEIIRYTRKLTSTEISGIEAYLVAKYAL